MGEGNAPETVDRAIRGSYDDRRVELDLGCALIIVDERAASNKWVKKERCDDGTNGDHVVATTLESLAERCR